MREKVNNSRWRRWFVILGCIAALLAMIIAGWWLWTDYQKQMTFKPAGQILYECWPERRSSRICLINADGTGYKQLKTIPGTPASQPSWSPDGLRLLYVANNKPSVVNVVQAVFVMNLDGTEARQLTDNMCNSGSPSWSPNGDYIAFVKQDDNKNCKGIAGIYLMRSDGTDLRQLTKYGYRPTWSPDGKKIAFTLMDVNLYTMDADGLNQVKLTDVVAYSSLVSWSPDSKLISFNCRGFNDASICVINSDGTNLKQLTSKSVSPSWSFDGQYIAYYWVAPFCFLCNLSGQLWIMKADGSYHQRLTKGPVDMNPAWRPTK
jgi:TolB protein